MFVKVPVEFPKENMFSENGNISDGKLIYSVDNKVNESHYGGSIQPLEFMQAQMSEDEFKGFLKGNIIKYVSRAGKKSSSAPIDDLRKAKRYLNWLIEVYEGKTVNPRLS